MNSIKSSSTWAKCKAKTEAEYGNQSQHIQAYFSFKIFYVLTFAQHLGNDSKLCKEVFCVTYLT